MSENREYKTVYLQDFVRYYGWHIMYVFTESALQTICKRSDIPITECGNIQCSHEGHHLSHTRVTNVEKAVIYRSIT